MSEQFHFEYVNCNLCGYDDTRLLYKVTPVRRKQSGEFTLVKCRKCDLVYLNPRLDSQTIANYYPENYEYHKTGSISLFEKLHFKYFRNPMIKKGRILDVGCGNGNYLLFLKKKGWDCYGTEINDHVIKHSINNLGLKIFKGELYDVTFPDKYFDVVTFWGSLEHMANPFKVLTKTNRLLKSGGKVIILLQNIESIGAKIFKRYWHHLEPPTHYYHFSPQTLTNLLLRTGFKIDRIRFDFISMDIIPSLGYVLNDIGIKVNFNNLVLKTLFIPLDILLSFFKKTGIMTINATK